ncbi:hypothetical protein NLO72_11850 [Pseudomonas tremae]|uniref:hypothetical protein n=1 Tax=Pseudomonas tremae TaxID=200454 RepID=UPI00210A2CEE|nr:hypothetical protein [Pseudomonas tremae]MCQ2989921.1 hypothetical protein [Pseudomonas tremae]
MKNLWMIFDNVAKILVGGIIIKGKEYNFSMIDLVAFLAKKPDGFVKQLGERLAEDDDLKCQTELLCMLFLSKYPFYTAQVVGKRERSTSFN